MPVKGDKRKLLELSLKNASLYRIERMKSDKKIKKPQFEEKALENLKRELNLVAIPLHIECVDNSNIQGTNPVASCVVFRNGVPVKSEYRHFNIKEVTGYNDFASMEEVVKRRFTYFKENNLKYPDVFIVDGGKGS